MGHMTRSSSRSLVAALTLLLAGFATGRSEGAGSGTRTFPESVDCTVRPYYRHRPDGSAGREVLLVFRGSRLYGRATVEITAPGATESVQLPVRPEGLDSVAITLPSGVGVREASEVLLSIRLGKDHLERNVQVPPLRHWTVFVYPHSHVDIGYSNTQTNVEFIHTRNIDKAISIAASTRQYPPDARYRWNTEVMWPFERYLHSATGEKKNTLLSAVRHGEICLDAAYVNILTTSCSDEEMFQQMRAQRDAVRLTGREIDTYVQVDIPGMAWGLVPVLAHEGVRYVMMMPNETRGNNEMVSAFRHKPFWWVGPDDSSKVLFLNAGGYGAGMDKGGKTGRPWFGQRDRSKIPEAITTDDPRADFLDRHLFRELPRLESLRYPYDIYVVTWAMWDNALQDADLPQAVRSWNAEYAYPHLVISSAHDIMRTFEKRYGNVLPVVRGDFTEYWTDGLGTAARQTKMNRNAKDRLVQAETLWPMLQPGRAAPRADLDEAWRFVVLGTEHTFTYENPDEPYFQEAIWKVKQRYFQEAEERSQTLLDEALAPASDKSNGALGPLMGPSNGGVAVFNTHSWAHGGVVTLTPSESRAGDRVVDDRGSELLSQRLSTGELLFLSPEVPPFGSRHYRVVKGSCAREGFCRATDTLLANGRVEVILDRSTGTITHLADIRSGREFADRSVNGGLNAFRWQPARGAGDARPDSVISVAIVESGPLVAELRVVSHAPGTRSVTRSVRLISGQPWVEIANIVDKAPLLPKDGVHFGFGFNLPGATTRVDIPWAVMRVEEDQWPAANRAWMTTQHFVDLSNDSAGVTWCSLDAPLFESGSITANNTALWDGRGDVWPLMLPRSSAIYSWVMNNHWFTNTPLTQEGPVTFRYRVLVHDGYDAARAYRFGVEQSQPLIALAADRDPRVQPPVAVAGDRIAVTILKSTADGKSMILRVRSLSDRDERMTLSWPGPQPRAVRVCERAEEAGPRDARRAAVVPARGIVTVRVDW